MSPEYNHSTTAPLKNDLDHLYREWHDKAVGFVGYGVDGGVRAVEHLRAFTAELGMAGVGPQVSLDLFEDFDDQGRCAPRQRQRDAATRMLGHLTCWAGALYPLSDDTAAGDATGNAVGDGDVRPRLYQQARTSDAEAVVAQLIGSGRAGCARCCGAPRKQRRGMIDAAHWAFGAGGGAAFGALPRDWRRRRWAGPVYGLVVWLGFELGIALVLGLRACLKT